MAISAIQKTGKVSRWGNSLGIRIPQEGVDRLNLKDGETVELKIKADSITIQRSKPRKKWTEAELLEGVTPDMCGPELIKGRAGREIL